MSGDPVLDELFRLTVAGAIGWWTLRPIASWFQHWLIREDALAEERHLRQESEKGATHDPEQRRDQ